MEIKVDGSEMEEIKGVFIDEAKSNSVNDALVLKKEELCKKDDIGAIHLK